ncbi:MAG: flavodoxin family protein [Bacillota bacterium]
MIKVLGISGSPRRGATDHSVREALKAAATVPGVETRYISLAGKTIKPCVNCDYCVRNKKLCRIKDDMADLYEPIVWADAYIIGSPVYNMTISGPLQTFFNRWRPLHHVYKGLLDSRVGGAIAVGGSRNGGQELTASALVHMFLSRGMVVVGGGGFDCYGGAYVVSHDHLAKGAEEDEIGMDSVRRLGRRVAQLAAWLKAGRGDEPATGPMPGLAVTGKVDKEARPES